MMCSVIRYWVHTASICVFGYWYVMEKDQLHVVVCCLLVGSSDRVRLSDVSAITLHSDKLTTGRRSSPVPQV